MSKPACLTAAPFEPWSISTKCLHGGWPRSSMGACIARSRRRPWICMAPSSSKSTAIPIVPRAFSRRKRHGQVKRHYVPATRSPRHTSGLQRPPPHLLANVTRRIGQPTFWLTSGCASGALLHCDSQATSVSPSKAEIASLTRLLKEWRSSSQMRQRVGDCKSTTHCPGKCLPTDFLHGSP